MRGVRARLVRFGLLALIYFATARLGLLLAIPSASAPPLWLPSGLSLALLLLLGLEAWPGIWLGATLSAASAGIPVLAGAVAGLGSAIGAVLAAYVIRRACGTEGPLHSARTVFAFGAASALGSAIGASVGTTTLGWAHLAGTGTAAWGWLFWWLGDWTSVLVLTPLVLAWRPALADLSSLRFSWRESFLPGASVILGCGLLL